MSEQRYGEEEEKRIRLSESRGREIKKLEARVAQLKTEKDKLTIRLALKWMEAAGEHAKTCIDAENQLSILHTEFAQLKAERGDMITAAEVAMGELGMLAEDYPEISDRLPDIIGPLEDATTGTRKAAALSEQEEKE